MLTTLIHVALAQGQIDEPKYEKLTKVLTSKRKLDECEVKPINYNINSIERDDLLIERLII
jgi:hypothetical protein